MYILYITYTYVQSTVALSSQSEEHITENRSNVRNMGETDNHVDTKDN